MSTILASEHAPWQLGTRVEKTRKEPGDAHEVGSLGTIVGVLPVTPEQYDLSNDIDCHFYFVEWDDLPGIPVGVKANKIRKWQAPEEVPN